MKWLVDHGLDRDVDDALAIELATAVTYAESHDRNEGLQAFAEGRPPRFTSE
ncbi:hypothetical protein ACWD4O_43945 [Streptomyces sp. NPDC002623]